MCAEIEHSAESLADIVEATDDAVGRLAMQEVHAAAPCRPVSVQPPCTAIKQRRRISGCHRSSSRQARPSWVPCPPPLRLRVDECARRLMMCPHGGLGNLYRQDFRSIAADRSGARRWRVAAALPFLW